MNHNHITFDIVYIEKAAIKLHELIMPVCWFMLVLRFYQYFDSGNALHMS